ncbi:hypothetical protein GCM10009616_37310 [Microlunatus lacustris]
MVSSEDEGQPAPGTGRPAQVQQRVDRAGPLRHLPPVGPWHPGSAYATVAGVLCAALPLPWDWATQASLTAVSEIDLVEAAGEVTRWLAGHGRTGWQLEVTSERAPLLVDALGLVPVREHDVWMSAGEPPAADLEVGPPTDEEEFLALFGPDLAPMIRGQLARPDWEVAVLREAGLGIGCLRLLDLAGTTYLGGVTVVASRRGQGLGRALAADATRRARRRSDLVWLHCEPELGPFYARLGYRPLGRVTFLGPARRD